MATKFNDILKAIQGAVDDFNTTVPASQKSMLNAIMVEIKDLDLTPGKEIKTSVKNLKLAGKIKAQLASLVLTDKYLGTVQDFVDSFQSISQLQNDYWNAIESTFKPGPLLEEIKQQNVADTVETLTGNGIPAQISEALTDIINANITTGASYAELTEQLRGALTDQGENLGLLSRYARTYTTDAINTYAAQYNQAISDDLGYEWFAYQGSDITTTRPFCDAMTDFTFFNKEEIPDLLAAHNLYYTNKKTGERELVPIYPKTGLPQGMKAGTNPANFFVNRGGWNCGHQIRPVSEKLVPTYIKNKKLVPGIQEKAIAAGPELDQFAKDIIKKYGGSLTPLNFKGFESIQRKSRDSLQGDPTKLTDAVRNTVVVPYAEMENVASSLEDSSKFPNVTRVKRQNGPDFYGYRGVIVNVKLKNGIVAEMQINSPEMIYAKSSKKAALDIMTEDEYNRIAQRVGLPGGRGHEFYDQIRELVPGQINKAQQVERDRLISESEAYYSNFYGVSK